MEEKKPQVPTTISRINDRGLIEILDVHTGRVLCVQTSYRDLLEEKFDRLTRIDTPEGPVYVEKGINFDIVNHLRSVPYSKVLGDLLCQDIVGGATLVRACAKLNLDYATVIRWQREHEGFKEALKTARKDRAEFLHDEILEKARTKASANTEIEALKWAAEVGDPERYSPKKKDMVAGGNTIQFIISTGIDRTQIPVAEPKDVTPKEEPGQ
jgi:hypothetical protein